MLKNAVAGSWLLRGYTKFYDIKLLNMLFYL